MRNRSAIASAAVLAGAVLAAACATSRAAPCPNAKELESTTLYFGLARAGAGGVSAADFAAFLHREVTARFPDGFTVSDAIGQWRGDGGIVEERSKVLTVVHPRGADDDKLEELRALYLKAFSQQSVLRVDAAVTGCF